MKVLFKTAVLPIIVCVFLSACVKPVENETNFSFPGAAVNNLKIELSADKSGYHLDEDIILTMTLTNLATDIVDDDIRVINFSPANRFFYTIKATYNGESSQILYSKTEKQDYTPLVIGKKESKEFTITMNESTFESMAENVKDVVEQFFGRPGMYIFRIEYSFLPKSATAVLGKDIYDKRYKNFWTGTVFSNEVSVTVS